MLANYNVKYNISIPYHPLTCGQVEVSNRKLKQFLEKTIDRSRKDWSKKLDDIIWAYITNFKTHLEDKAYWAIKFLNFDEKEVGSKRLLNMGELEEIVLKAYKNVVIYKKIVKS